MGVVVRGAARGTHGRAGQTNSSALEEKDGEFPCFKDKTGTRVLDNGKDLGQVCANIASPGSQSHSRMRMLYNS